MEAKAYALKVGNSTSLAECKGADQAIIRVRKFDSAIYFKFA